MQEPTEKPPLHYSIRLLSHCFRALSIHWFDCGLLSYEPSQGFPDDSHYAGDHAVHALAVPIAVEGGSSILLAG